MVRSKEASGSNLNPDRPGPASTAGSGGRRIVLRVDPIACDGRGICAELFPEMVSLDDWGFPIIDGSPIPPRLVGAAKRAAAACPTLAFHLDAG